MRFTCQRSCVYFFEIMNHNKIKRVEKSPNKQLSFTNAFYYLYIFFSLFPSDWYEETQNCLWFFMSQSALLLLSTLASHTFTYGNSIQQKSKRLMNIRKALWAKLSVCYVFTAIHKP